MTKTSRRKILRSGGIAIALPFLESWGSRRHARVWAAAPDPVRYGYLYQPNGMNGWNIGNVGSAPGETTTHTLSGALAPLAPLQKNFSIIRGMDNYGPGPGAHNPASACWLTGQTLKDNQVAKVDISVDQVAAAALGSRTAVPSLQIGTHPSNYNKVGQDSGVNNEYLKNISWRADGSPMRTLSDPMEIFKLLFSGGGAPVPGPQNTGLKVDRSILDYVLADAKSFTAKLGARDKLKVDEYLGNVRTTESKVAGMLTGTVPAVNMCGSATPPAAVAATFDDHLRIMFDLLALAFACDRTRIATFQMGIEFGDADFNPIVNMNAHHSAIHTGPEYFAGGAAGKAQLLEGINKFYATRVAGFLTKLTETQEATGSVLDNSMIVFGSGLQVDHNNSNIYTLVAGKGGGALSPGRHIVLKPGTPFSNLHVTLLNKLGVASTSFGQSNGTIANL